MSSFVIRDHSGLSPAENLETGGLKRAGRGCRHFYDAICWQSGVGVEGRVLKLSPTSWLPKSPSQSLWDSSGLMVAWRYTADPSPVSSPRFSASLWNLTVFYICQSTLLCSQRAMIDIRKNGGVPNNKIYHSSVAVQLLDVFGGGWPLGDRLSRLVTFIHFKNQTKFFRRTSVDIKVLEVPILFLMSIWSCGGQGE